MESPSTSATSAPVSPAPAMAGLPAFEKLGAFYLGREVGPEGGPTDQLVLYDSRDLVTHAVCVGMTGSGKTGLCVTLIEEAAIDGIPALVIDPKGDLANLLLTFPDLSPADFAAWVNEDDARRKGLTTEQFTQQQADAWRSGLQSWGQDGARIRRLRDAAEFTIYTPGSSAGVAVSIVKSFAAPPPAIRDDIELLNERVGTTVTGLLSLIGMEADPVQSREHILLSTILLHAWRAGRDADLATLIGLIQSPPMARVGVMELESFYPSAERFALAMRLNNLLAAPGFQSWLEGEPLDVGSLLFTPQGKPRVAIFSIAHLGDAERMFFVSLLLNQTLGWMRAQPGTTSLRAIVYMDEIFGYFPPVANPPSKPPLLTLLKQARAFGVGVMLATQNPVDIDYKGLSNAGTWFIGRLQTERDKQRVIGGLEGAAAGGGFDRARTERLLSSLRSRVFYMHNVHEPDPVLFETRWAMSYLRGPLTRDQIRRLAQSSTGQTSDAGDMAAVPAEGDAVAAAPSKALSARPVLPPDVPQTFLPLRGHDPAEGGIIYMPFALGCAEVAFRDRAGASATREICLLAPWSEAGGPDWTLAAEPAIAPEDLEREPRSGSVQFDELPAAATRARHFSTWTKELADVLYRTQVIELQQCAELKVTGRADESQADFAVRLRQALHERRDEEVDRLRKRYAPKIAAMQERIRRAEQAVARESEQARQAGLSTAVSVGSTILGALFGRRRITVGTVTRAGSAARGAGRTVKERGDIARAEETVRAVAEQLAELEREFDEALHEVSRRLDEAAARIERIPLRPKKADITIRLVALAWAPHRQGPDGKLIRAWE